MEQSVWYGSARIPTLNEDLLNEETYKNLNNNCEVMEQKSKMVEQGRTGSIHDGLDGIFRLNQDETMRIE